MQQPRYTKIVVRSAVVVAALVVAVAALSALEQRRTQAELSAALSALFSDEILRDAHDSGSPRAVQVIILREAPQSLIWKERWLDFVFDWEPLFPRTSVITRTSFWLSNVISTNTEVDLHLPQGADFFLLRRRELERRFPNNVGYFGVSQAGLNFDKTEAVFYIEHYCPGLCGSGSYILMRKVNGVWSVVDHHDTWES